jgi:predicted transcriptional regulator
MTEPTVESMFGVKAGLVWEAINKNGPCSINELAKLAGLRRELVYGALGWLARENKISMERSGRTLVLSLKE